MGKYFSDERNLDRQCVKRKSLPIKTNRINSAKNDSDSDDSSTFLLKINNQITS